jgi:hypothetical protein
MTQPFLSVIFLASALGAPVLAQAPADGAEKKPDFPPFEKVADGLEKVVSVADGSAPLYELWAEPDGARLLAVLPAGFESQDVMIACTVTGGHPEAGVMGPTHYGHWKRIDKQLAFVVPNTNRRTDDKSSREAVTNLYSARMLLAVPILTMKGARPVIDLGRLATVDTGKLFAGSGYGPTITTLQASLARRTKAKAFPENVVLEYEAPQSDGQLVRVAYSIGQLEGTPGYEPREADARVGYFYDWYVDTTPGEFDEEPHRYINRWCVEKADPKLSLSPPKQPIVWYVEHTTPIKYRRWVREGIELWNAAFEKVGIVDAVEVYQQDATTGAHMEKDPEDARYNFFRWNMSEASYAIGPSRSNPRTGEILDADVVWNQGLTRSVSSMMGSLSRALVDESTDPELLAWLGEHPSWDPRPLLGGHVPAGLATAPEPQQDFLRAHGLAQAACRMGNQLAVDLSLVGAAFDAGLLETEDDELLDGVPEEFLGPMIRYISAHEVGHCLGLQHNMTASSLTTLEEMNAAGFDGLTTASVMDYVAPNLARPGQPQGPFINDRVGPYDEWAIALGYGPEGAIEGLLEQSSRPEHLFLSQASMSFGSDPRNQTWEVGADNLEFCEARMKLVSDLRAKLTDELVEEGESWAHARRRYQQLLGSQARTLLVAATWIGGAYESNDHKGTPDARPPITDVDPADQRRALEFVIRSSFDDAAYGLTPELVRHLGKESWWDPAGIEELMQDTSFSVHDTVGGFQAMGLALLLSPSRLRRVHDAEFRTCGNEDRFTLAELLTRVTDGAWKECLETTRASYDDRSPLCSSFRRNLQHEHVGRLIDLVLLEDAPSPALRAITALAAQELRRVDELAAGAEQRGPDAATRAHLTDVRTRIRKALDAAYVKKG